MQRQRWGVRLEVVKHTEVKRGFVLRPRQWVVERSFVWAARFRRLARDYERLAKTLAFVIAFGMLDVDPKEHHDICGRHKILNLPSLTLYRDGSLIQIVKGKRRPDEIIEYLRQLIS